ncbi:hypothetical protein AB751O23_AF_00070 [Chlamydiales bacterium SCGC AB-751-O23]|nr:hypothetical protein AB751O23_AF_00070 [Chlamydiales bacterium SCGC AB-751-O23]
MKNLNYTEALNLDGGSSLTIVLNNKTINQPYALIEIFFQKCLMLFQYFQKINLKKQTLSRTTTRSYYSQTFSYSVYR